MGKVLAVSNQKGGVGKTTTAVNLAACLAVAGHNTLLIDMDPQANATSACGLDVNNLESTVYDALHDPEQRPIYPAKVDCDKLFVMPSSIDLTGAEMEMIDMPDRERVFKRLVDGIKGDYDYIIIDAPPSLGLLTINILAAAEGAIVPVQSEYFALEGLSSIIKTINLVNKRLNPDLSLLGILVTMFDGRTNLSRQVADEMRRIFPDKMFNTVITRSIRLSEAPSHGKPIIFYDPRSVGAENYTSFAKEVVHACEEESIRARA